MRFYRFIRAGAVPTGWLVLVRAPLAYTLTALARAEMAEQNGAQIVLVEIVATEGSYTAEFQFVSETGARLFVDRAKQTAGLGALGSPCRKGKAA